MLKLKYKNILVIKNIKDPFKKYYKSTNIFIKYYNLKKYKINLNYN